MATYGTDLTDLAVADSDVTEAWTELASPYNAGGTPADDDENLIQGVNCQSQTTGTKSGLVFSLVFDATADQSGSFATDDVVLMWQFYAVGANLETYANGGLRIVVGASTSAWSSWDIGGSDYARNPYGGWTNVAVDPTLTADDTVGGGHGGAYRYFGSIPFTLASISKGTPHAVDAIRYGRGEIYCTGTGCTFTGMAQENDYNDATNGYHRWGLFSSQGGVFLWKGLLSFGQSATSATFVDSNKTIIIDDAAKTYLAFNKVEVQNASTSVTLTSVSFTALGTVSPGSWENIANATLVLTGCSFNQMATFIFGTNSDVLGCVFNTCGKITTAGADMTGSKVLLSAVAADNGAINWNVATNPDGYLDDMEFSKGAALHHAIEFGTTALQTMTLRGIAFGTGWGATDSTSATLLLPDTGSDVTWNISLVGCTGTITTSQKRVGDTVNLIIDPVTTTITVKDITTGVAIEDARVLMLAADATGDLPYNITLTSITRSGTTATVTFPSAHGLVAGDIIHITGASDHHYNGSWPVATAPTTTTLTYTMLGTPAASASGTLKGTGGIFNELTSALGVVTDSRSITADQPLEGQVRRSTTSPLYKTQPLEGTIDSVNGLILGSFLQLDE